MFITNHLAKYNGAFAWSRQGPDVTGRTEIGFITKWVAGSAVT